MAESSLIPLGSRVRVKFNDTDEPELVGMVGTVSGRTEDGRCVVFLDGDEMPSYFPPDELEAE